MFRSDFFFITIFLRFWGASVPTLRSLDYSRHRADAAPLIQSGGQPLSQPIGRLACLKLDLMLTFWCQIQLPIDLFPSSVLLLTRFNWNLEVLICLIESNDVDLWYSKSQCGFSN